MKRLILMVIAVLFSSLTWAQSPTKSASSENGGSIKSRDNAEPGRLQLSAFGGLSMPMGKYKNEIGRAKNGYFG